MFKFHEEHICWWLNDSQRCKGLWTHSLIWGSFFTICSPLFCSPNVMVVLTWYLLQIIERAEMFENKAILLIHFSARYKLDVSWHFILLKIVILKIYKAWCPCSVCHITSLLGSWAADTLFLFFLIFSLKVFVLWHTSIYCFFEWS